MSKRSDLLIDVLSKNPDIENVMLRLKVIISDIPNSENIQNWLNNELTGYPNGEELPKYRHLHGYIYGNFVVNYNTQYTHSLVPLKITTLEKDIIESLEDLKISDSISVIVSTMANNEKIGVPVPTELLYSISSEKLQLSSAVSEVDASRLNEIISEIKNKLIEIIQKLENQFSVESINKLDVKDEIKENVKEIKKLNINIEKIIFGDSIKIGDNNTIKKSKLGFLKKIIK
ncbi:AbiTii domain-containing protein [Companilactobacillus sp. DQM5]|uniref:AbiTii domain-containing protein n=1 Tax=Companilactobacillus sp. DQM5 TaxID=3463359 RepID=UPI004059B382